MWPRHLLAILVVVYALIGASVFLLMPQPYMDEIFHVPQAQKWCNSDFSWDPMITTLPGLYLTSLLFLGPGILSSALLKVLGVDVDVAGAVCPTTLLRLTNAFFGLLTAWLLWELIPPARRTTSKVFKVLWILFCPVGFLYYFVYYTDAGALFWLLMGHYLLTKNRPFLSALACAAAVLFRQTSIVWVAYIAADHLLSDLESDLPECANLSLQGVFARFADLLRCAWKIKIYLVKRYWGHVAVGIGFVLFVFLNGSLVVGDKEHHVAGVSFAQLLYFSLFVCLAFGPLLVPLLIRAWKGFIRSPRHFVALVVCIHLCLTFGSVIHPYMLADNRHLSFALWKNVIRPVSTMHLPPKITWIDYVVGYLRDRRGLRIFATYTLVSVPVTLAAMADIPLFHGILYIIALTLNLVPSSLFEPRYFLTPLTFLMLNYLQSTKKAPPATRYPIVQRLATVSSIAISLGTVALFLKHPLHLLW
ncbi:hypothetical protein; 2-glucosyltransferase ALG10-A [Paratrimastix pyriformis]|uniref:Dol-P-Glc:Glc(2)Man(9)GlcNAc(2)-PP-Dol alpha-1,2-glucosyltransferase n=1 Tax=Paratrimastix pyriformis TaxID=342808 RepID=A0ABQ8UAV5_9EUKA|nr:hypothetical protein; 2-glucosyltransferase ALG10-A [Paratrimastix pyriformis]